MNGLFTVVLYRECGLPWCLLCWPSGVFLWSEGLFPTPQLPLWGNGHSTDQCPETYTYSINKSAFKYWTKWYAHDILLIWGQSYRILLWFLLLRRVLFAIYWHCPHHQTERQKNQPFKPACHPWISWKCTDVHLLDSLHFHPKGTPRHWRIISLYSCCENCPFKHTCLSTNRSWRERIAKLRKSVCSSRKHTEYVWQQMQLVKKTVTVTDIYICL